MFRNVLIPVDLSEHNRIALEAVPKVAAPGADVELLHVVQRVDADPELESFYRLLERKAEQVLRRWCGELEKQGFAARVEIRVGNRGTEIVERARGRDLLVIASHALTGADGRLGTLSHQLAMVAPCAVLLVR